MKEHKIEFMSNFEFELEESSSQPKPQSVRRLSRMRKPMRHLDPDWKEQKYDKTEPLDRNPRFGNSGPTYVQFVKNKKQSNENKENKIANWERSENNNIPKKVTFVKCHGRTTSVAFSQLADGTEAVEYSKGLSSVVMMILEKMVMEKIWMKEGRYPTKKHLSCNNAYWKID